MIRAILREIEKPGSGKSQTRRVLKKVPEPPSSDNVVHLPPRHERPYLDAYNKTSWWCWWTRDDRPCEQFEVKYATGDHLWVRETWAAPHGFDTFKPSEIENGMPVHYAATAELGGSNNLGGLIGRPSIFMPRWASRLTLEVTNVRVERLQDISDKDAEAEGVEWESADPPFYYVPGIYPHSITAVGVEEPGGRHAARSYFKLWDHINGLGSAAKNPFVVAVTFRPHLINIDAFLKQREAA
jgi:hypothetical protein